MVAASTSTIELLRALAETEALRSLGTLGCDSLSYIDSSNFEFCFLRAYQALESGGDLLKHVRDFAYI